MKNLTTNDRIKHLISFKQLSISSFSREIGLINGVTISKIINQNRKPSSKTIGRIIQAFPDINYDWLVNGEGEMIKGSVVKSVKTHEDDLTVTTKQVIDFMKEYYPNSTQESENRLDKKIDIGKKELIDFMYLGKSDLHRFYECRQSRFKRSYRRFIFKSIKEIRRNST